VGLNLHAVVRAPIQSVNPDIMAAYLQSRGSVIQDDGSVLPAYAAPFYVRIQAQPPTGRDLRHAEYLNLQGVLRTVYLYSNPQAVDRVAARGGDLLMFPQSRPHVVYDSQGRIVTNSEGLPVLSSAPLDLWLVSWVDEWYDAQALGWTKLIATLQADGRQIVLNSNRLPVLNSQGALVTSQ
jgi:hypothetical protein